MTLKALIQNTGYKYNLHIYQAKNIYLINIGRNLIWHFVLHIMQKLIVFSHHYSHWIIHVNLMKCVTTEHRIVTLKSRNQEDRVAAGVIPI